jgi:hypothetical protein
MPSNRAVVAATDRHIAAHSSLLSFSEARDCGSKVVIDLCPDGYL